MWLLNATPSDKLKSMATYFKPTIGFFTYSTNNDKLGDENNNQIDSSSKSQPDSQSELLTNIQLKINTDIANGIGTFFNKTKVVFGLETTGSL
jgi:hypothetical protein